MIWDGRVLVTPGEAVSGSTQALGADAQATLLVTAQVNQWERHPVPNDMTQTEFERFVVDRARASGIDARQPFPFLVIGEITDYVWHVVTGAPKGHDAGAKHQQGHADARWFSGAQAQGKLVGFYSAESLEGIISHPGERFHVHYASDDLAISGHLDRYGVRKGATLLLPKQ